MAGLNWRSPSPISEEGTYTSARYSAPRAITASAVKIDLKDKRDSERLRKRLEGAAWQREAWDYYDHIGEISFSANLIANTLSKINLYVAYVDDTARVPAPVRLAKDVEDEHAEIAEEIIHLLETGDGGPSGVLRDAALSMFIAGECYLIREPEDVMRGIPEKWQIRSIDELIVKTTARKRQYFLRSSRTDSEEDYIPLPSDTFVARMWRPHPRYSAEADSSMRGILDECDDLMIFSREGRISSRSRTNAGILFIPSEFDDSAVPDSDDEDEFSDGSDDNEESLAEMITQTLNDASVQEDHVNNNVPLVLRGPAEYADSLKHIEFSRPIDTMFENLINFKLDRILQALDIPKDLAKGLSDLKYNSGAIIEESLYRSHIEPLILLIVDQLTSGFLRPGLVAQGVPPEVAKRMTVWYDPSAIMAKPAKSEAANFGVEKDAISLAAWRAANGFSDADAPSQQEVAQKLLMAKLVLDPQLATTMLNEVLPEVMNSTRNASQATTDPSSANALNDALGLDPDTVPQDFESGDVQLTPDQVDTIGSNGGLDGLGAPNSGPNLIEP